VKGNAIKRGETPEETHVVRLIHPTAEPVPVPLDRDAGGISRRSGFGGTCMARHRWPPSHRWPRFRRPVWTGSRSAFPAVWPYLLPPCWNGREITIEWREYAGRIKIGLRGSMSRNCWIPPEAAPFL